MIEVILCNWLRDNEQLIAEVPHIFAISLPEKPTFPAIRISRITSDVEQTYSGVSGEETAIIQIDYWAEKTEKITAIKKLLIAFFNTLTVDKADILAVNDLREQPSYEPKQNIFKQTLGLTISYKVSM